MILSDRDIKSAVELAEIGIIPFKEKNVQPSSVDLTLSELIRKPFDYIAEVDLAEVIPDYTYLETIPDYGYQVKPGEFFLAETAEKVYVGLHHAARVEGKSSIGRVGLAAHVTAGFIDPGFSGTVTLEIVNLAPYAIRVYSGMPIAQIAFFQMSSIPDQDYSKTGHYMGQTGPTESRYSYPRKWES